MKIRSNFLKISLLSFLLLPLIFSCNNEQKNWENAKQQNTVEAYKDFIDENPKSEFVSEAETKIANLDWADATKANNPAIYRVFLAKHPDHASAGEARQLIDSLEWLETKNANTIESYKKFAERNPESQMLDSANYYIECLNGTWADGFLNKKYMAEEKKIDQALHDIFSRSIAFSYGDVPNGYFQTYGVGDENGNWSLNGKGGMVTVKIVMDQGNIIVGFRIDKGDRNASLYFHKLLKEKLDGNK